MFILNEKKMPVLKTAWLCANCNIIFNFGSIILISSYMHVINACDKVPHILCSIWKYNAIKNLIITDLI